MCKLLSSQLPKKELNQGIKGRPGRRFIIIPIFITQGLAFPEAVTTFSCLIFSFINSLKIQGSKGCPYLANKAYFMFPTPVVLRVWSHSHQHWPHLGLVTHAHFPATPSPDLVMRNLGVGPSNHVLTSPLGDSTLRTTALDQCKRSQRAFHRSQDKISILGLIRAFLLQMRKLSIP